MAMQLIHFEKIDSNSLHPASVQKKTKDEQAAEITCRIMLSTKKTEPIFVTYHPPTLPPDAESGDDRSKISKSSNGTAVKEGVNKWHVSLDNDTTMTATNDDLMDASKFYVEKRWLTVNQDESKKKKQSAKQKRARQTEQVEKEKRIREKGLEQLRTMEYEEYNKMCERFKSGDVFQFEEFLDMIDRMRKPLVCQIEGHEVSLMQDDCAIMMEASAVRAITDSLFVDKEKQNGQGNNQTMQQQQNK